MHNIPENPLKIISKTIDLRTENNLFTFFLMLYATYRKSSTKIC